MKKLHFSKKQVIVSLLVFVTLAALVTFFTSSRVRNPILVWAVQNTTARGLEGRVQKRMDSLNDPFKQLGYTSTKTTPVHCELSYNQGIKTQVMCSYTVSAYQEVSRDSATAKKVVNQAASLQDALKATGWRGTFVNNSEYTSLNLLTSNIYNDIDYTPDAAYDKDDGELVCLFDSNTAYSKPKPPAMASRFNCWQNFNVFGKPNTNLLD